MKAEISELRFGELDAALAITGAAGVSLQAKQVRHELSLKARLGEEMTAVALCVCLADGDYELHVIFAEGKVDEAIARTLLDKSLLKLASVRLQKCRIVAPQLVDKPDFWAATKWNQSDESQDTRHAA